MSILLSFAILLSGAAHCREVKFDWRPEHSEQVVEVARRTLSGIDALPPEIRRELGTMELAFAETPSETEIARFSRGRVTINERALQTAAKSLASWCYDLNWRVPAADPDQFIPETLGIQLAPALAHELRHAASNRVLGGISNIFEEEFLGLVVQVDVFRELVKNKSWVWCDTHMSDNYRAQEKILSEKGPADFMEAMRESGDYRFSPRISLEPERVATRETAALVMEESLQRARGSRQGTEEFLEYVELAGFWHDVPRIDNARAFYGREVCRTWVKTCSGQASCAPFAILCQGAILNTAP